MKREIHLLIAAVVAAASLLVGCDKTPKPSGEGKKLSASVESIEFDVAGGSQEIKIDASSGLGWTVSSDADWVSLSPKMGTGLGTVLVSAGANASYAPLSATLTVSAEGAEPVKIAVSQASADAPAADALKLKTVNCYYAGDYWGTDGKLDDVYFEMTDMTAGADGKLQGPGTAIMIDVNIAASSFENFSIEGTYTPSSLDTPVNKGTFNVDAKGEVSPTYVISLSADGIQTRKDAVGGKLSIVKSGTSYIFDLLLTFGDGTQIKAVYSGEIKVYNDSVKCNSTLSSNVAPEYKSARGTFGSWGQEGMSADYLILNLIGDTSAENCEYLMLTLDVSPSAWNEGKIEGSYKIIEKSVDEIYTSEMVPGTAIPGYLSQDSAGNVGLGGSWYYSIATVSGQSQLSSMAPFTSGTVNVKRDGETFELTYSFVDDNPLTPHTVSGSYTGPINFTNLKGGTTPEPTPDPDPDPKPDPDPTPDPEPDPDPTPDKPLKDLLAGANLVGFTEGGRW